MPRRGVDLVGIPHRLEKVTSANKEGGCSPKGVDTRRMQVRTLGPKGGGFGGDPTSIGERNKCQQRRRYTRGGVPVRTLGPEGEVDLVGIPHRLEKGRSASKDAGPRREVDCENS